MAGEQFPGMQIERGSVLTAHSNVGSLVFFEVVEPKRVASDAGPSGRHLRLLTSPSGAPYANDATTAANERYGCG
jgi:hypothetical protein